jgi:CBS domain-containing protein
MGPPIAALQTSPKIKDLAMPFLRRRSSPDAPEDSRQPPARTKDKKLDFLSRVHPFAELPEQDLEKAAQSLSKSHFYKDMTLFVQGKTILNYVYIVLEGQLEQYIRESDQKLLRSFLGEGDIYGGLSVLFNKGTSIRTVRCLDDVTFYRLPKEVFLDLCSRNEDFTRYFTESFGQKMLAKPYIEFIAQDARRDEGQAPPGFLNQSLSNLFAREIVACDADTPIQEAARIMNERKRSALVVQDASGGAYNGLITDHDLREKVIAPGYSIQQPVRDVMSTPLVSIESDSQVFEAILLMMQRNIKHLAITDETGDLLGVATEQDLLLSQGQSPVILMHQIHESDTVEEIVARYRHLPGMIKTLIDGGAKAEHLNRMITSVSDAILEKVLDFAIQELGPPPSRFAFIIMGSEGRKEQTLKTDQDNAIIFEDVHEEALQERRNYFLGLARKVCGWLNDIGYTYCDFDIMAQNPTWCQPLSQWKEYFSEWIHTAEPEALLDASIFFDFRLGYGDQELVKELQQHLFKTLSGWAGFFRHMVENALHFKPPLDFFGGFVLQNRDGLKNVLDIKSPMRLIVDFARLYSLQRGIESTNTLERLQEIFSLGTLERPDYEELSHAYRYLMQTRISHQVHRIIDEGKEPNNLIDPKRLTHIEQQSLKESFKRIRMAQGKMRMEFAQDIGIT